MHRPLVIVALSVSLAAAAGLCAPAQAAPRPPAKAARPYDFDGDGRPELVVGAPFLQVGPVRAAGGVAVLAATSSGLAKTATILTQTNLGAAGASEEGDELGAALASGDFDADGFADLAVGQPYEDVGGVDSAGAVTLVYGSAAGLDTSRSVVLQQPGGVREAAFFGTVLASADLDGDGYDDLAVAATLDGSTGVPGQVRNTYGSVTLLRGGASGLSRTASSVLQPRTAGTAYDVGFGAALAAGDLDGDGRAELVVGSRGSRARDDDDEGEIDAQAGAVSVCRGGSPLPTSCAQVAFGTRYTALSSLAVGDVDGSAVPEVVVGVPESADVDDPSPGSVHVLQLAGLTARAKDLVLTQSSAGVPGTDRKQSEQTDEFGSAVAVGDLDRDGYADLVIGAPGEDGYRGRVTVVRGAKGGYRTSGNTTYDQDTKGVPSKAERAEDFGQSLALDDHDGDGRLDLSVGADDEDGVDGVVTTLRGSGTTFTTKGSRTFGLTSLGYPTPREGGFGEVLGG